MNGYRAPWWLPGRHAQTILPSLWCLPYITFRRDRWRTPPYEDRILKPDPPLGGNPPQDDDFIDVDSVGDPGASNWLVVLHGLEGSSQSAYARKLAKHAMAKNWYLAVPHFRGCSGWANERLRDYHSGSSDEVDWILRRFKEKLGNGEEKRLFVVGSSLGANALLKWLGRREDEAKKIVNAAVSVSAPFELSETAARLARGFSLVYSKAALANNLRGKALEKLSRFPGAYDKRLVKRAATLRDFEDAVVAPVNGFRDANDYYARASARPCLHKIRVPTLVLNARNDPFMGAHVLDALLGEVPHGGDAPLSFEFPGEGGHAGFADGKGWLVDRIFEFLEQPR